MKDSGQLPNLKTISLEHVVGRPLAFSQPRTVLPLVRRVAQKLWLTQRVQLQDQDEQLYFPTAMPFPAGYSSEDGVDEGDYEPSDDEDESSVAESEGGYGAFWGDESVAYPSLDDMVESEDGSESDSKEEDLGSQDESTHLRQNSVDRRPFQADLAGSDGQA